jgi:hypothetical protein
MYNELQHLVNAAKNSYEPMIANRITSAFFKQVQWLLASTRQERHFEIG